eukprot:2073758-Rhodomonas_salina.1
MHARHRHHERTKENRAKQKEREQSHETRANDRERAAKRGERESSVPEETRGGRSGAWRS